MNLRHSDIGKEFIVSLKNGDAFVGCLTNVGAAEVEFNGWVWVGRGEIVSLVGTSGGRDETRRGRHVKP